MREVASFFTPFLFFKEEITLHVLFKIIQVSGYSCLLSMAVINISTKNNLEGKDCFLLHITVYH